MNKFRIGLTVLSVVFVVLMSSAQNVELVYAPSMRYAPDRDFDIAWENDLVAFRVYGKQPSPDAGLSGIDCWHKKVSYPIADKWYKGNLAESGYYHIDHGEGCDKYHVGKTRGCGGLGLWKNNEILRSGLYESWEVISQTQTSLSFKLVYSWIVDGERFVETRTISIVNGSQLFEATSQFTKNGFPVKDLEIAIGLSTQNGIAKVTMNEEDAWISAWHTLGEDMGMIGTGVVVDKRYLLKMLEQKSDNKDESHVLAIVKTDANGVIKYKSGFAWDKAEKITTEKAWNDYLGRSE